MHVHFVNDPAQDAGQFHVTEALVAEALAQRPELRERLRVSIGAGEEGLAEAARTADVLVGWSFPLELVRGAPKLRWIHLTTAGVEHLHPFDWLPDGVTLTNSSGIHAERAGEYIACGLLMLNNLMPQHLEDQAARRWSPRYSGVIAGGTVVVVGVGAIGGEGARRARELGLRVRGVRRSGAPHPHVDEMYTPAEIEKALPGADFVVVASALTPETRGLLDARRLDLLPEHAGIVNVARAAIVDYGALEERLRGGRLGGAILDVFDPEPLPPDSSLWTCPRLVITPHVSSDPLDYAARVLAIFADNLARLADGAPLRNVVDLQRGY